MKEKRGKIIVLEGTDYSGKTTQAKVLVKKFKEEGINVELISFPRYNTPTGRIIGGPYLGKKDFGESWFKEGAENLDPIVSSLYYTADRVYAIKEIKEKINSGTNLILDRYTFANMAHQGGKVDDPIKRKKFYRFIEKLEFELIGLPKPNLGIFLHVSEEVRNKLNKKRKESPDGHEKSHHHLNNSEKAYFELAKMYNWKVINCTPFINLNNPEEGINKLSNVLYELIYPLF
jgi:dTMP kinase